MKGVACLFQRLVYATPPAVVFGQPVRARRDTQRAAPLPERPRRLAALLLAALPLAALPLAALLLATEGPAWGQQPGAASVEANIDLAEHKAAEAFEAYEARRYADAVALYVEAFSAAPNADILYNIARIYDTGLGDRQLAMSFYRRYIADPGAVSSRIKLANVRLALLREAEIAASPSTAAPVSPANPSHREELAGSEARPRDGVAAEPRTKLSLRPVGLAIGSVGVVGIGIGTGFGLAALAQAHTAKRLCDGNLCSEQRGIDAVHTASERATISTVGFAAGGVLVAIGAALFLASDEPNTEQPRGVGANSAVDSPSWRLALGKDGGSVQLGGAW